MPELTPAQLDRVKEVVDRLKTTITIQHHYYFYTEQYRAVVASYELGDHGGVYMILYAREHLVYRRIRRRVSDYRFL